MYVFAALSAVTIVALLLGLKLGKGSARILLIVALVIFAASFVLYVLSLNYSRDAGQWGFRGVAQEFAFVSWIGLYASSGFLGPALAKKPALAATLSTAALAATLTGGTYAMFSFACGFAGDCI